MDDRTTTTDFIRTQPLDRPVTRKRVKSKTGRRLGLLLLVAAAAAAGWWIYTRQPTPPPARQNAFTATMPVVAAGAVTGDIDITLNGLGTVTSLATVTIKSQISGQLVRVAYQEGQMINKGDLVAEIDSRPYELALAQAQGALERDQALLQAAELDLKRYQDLAKTNAIPRQQLDTQVSLVAQDKGLVISDKAQIDTQKLNIAYCHIVSPVTGRAGLRLVDPGNYVTANDASGIVVITQLKPISVIFTVAEDNLPQIVKRLRAGATLPVTAFDRSGTTKLATGTLKTLDNQIDTTTGTLKLRAEFANEDDSLFPNQFVNIRLLIDTLHDATVRCGRRRRQAAQWREGRGAWCRRGRGRRRSARWQQAGPGRRRAGRRNRNRRSCRKYGNWKSGAGRRRERRQAVAGGAMTINRATPTLPSPACGGG